ncbi:MAG: hypothetical protein IPP47_09445 [Bryobacterales bacterium]|nr:hypothetical protein [Bryobacterales bacterium]
MRVPPSSSTVVPGGASAPKPAEAARAANPAGATPSGAGPASDAEAPTEAPRPPADRSGEAIDASLGKLRFEQAKETKSPSATEYLAYTGPQGSDKTSAAHLTQLRGFDRISEMSKNFERGLDPSIRGTVMKSASQLGMTHEVLAKAAGYLSTLSPGDIQTMAGAPGMKGYDERLEMISGLREGFKDAIARGDQKAFNRIIEQHGGVSGTVLTAAEVSRREMALRQINDVAYKQMDPYDFRGSLEHVGTMISEKGTKETGKLVLAASLNNSMPGARTSGSDDPSTASGGNTPLIAGTIIGGGGKFRKPNQAEGVPRHVEEVHPGTQGQGLNNPGQKLPQPPKGGGGAVVEGGAEATVASDTVTLGGERATMEKMIQGQVASAEWKAEIQAAGEMAEGAFTRGTVSATGVELGGALEIEGAAATRANPAMRALGKFAIGVMVLDMGASLLNQAVRRSNSSNPFPES